jgi:pilus assembly protein CpaF
MTVVLSDLTGDGLLAGLLRDPAVTDVLVNGAGPVWVDRGDGLRRTDVIVDSEDAARRLAVRLVMTAGRRLDDAVPYADGRLPDGTRVHAVLPPAAPEGTHISLRVPPSRTFGLDDLIGLGALPAAGAELLQRMVAARAAYLVTGGTGSGKTTLLSTLLSLVPARERIVLVEDAAEIRPRHPHVVRLQARPPNAEGSGAIPLEELVRQALRMRPDRLVVGEARGSEVLQLLSALNTGHDGGCSTVHANRLQHLPSRIEALCGQAGLGRAAAHSLLAAAVDAVVHLVRGPDGRRRVAGVGVLTAVGGEVCAVPASRFGPDRLEPADGAAAFDDRVGRP